jgi:hypothetical protein
MGDRDRVPKPVRATTESFIWESSGYDCSIKQTVRVPTLTRYIAEGMHLNWLGREGKLFDRAGILVALDPSVETKGPSALLVRREPLLKWLRENQSRLLWTLVGEKQIMGRTIALEELQGWVEVSGAAILDGRDKVNATIRSKIARPK